MDRHHHFSLVVGRLEPLWRGYTATPRLCPRRRTAPPARHRQLPVTRTIHHRSLHPSALPRWRLVWASQPLLVDRLRLCRLRYATPHRIGLRHERSLHHVCPLDLHPSPRHDLSVQSNGEARNFVTLLPCYFVVYPLPLHLELRHHLPGNDVAACQPTHVANKSISSQLNRKTTQDLEEVTLCVTAGLDLRWMTSLRHPTPKGSHITMYQADELAFRLVHPLWGQTSSTDIINKQQQQSTEINNKY